MEKLWSTKPFILLGQIISHTGFHNSFGARCCCTPTPNIATHWLGWLRLLGIGVWQHLRAAMLTTSVSEGVLVRQNVSRALPIPKQAEQSGVMCGQNMLSILKLIFSFWQLFPKQVNVYSVTAKWCLGHFQEKRRRNETNQVSRFRAASHIMVCIEANLVELWPPWNQQGKLILTDVPLMSKGMKCN